METEQRVVVDTNVFISAALMPHSVPRRAVALVMQSARLLVSVETVCELNDVLRRPKFDRYASEASRLEYLAAAIQGASLVEATDQLTACRDPKDDKFLNLAVAGRATHIISGDRDLLVLNAFQGVAIVTPQQFLDSFHFPES